MSKTFNSSIKISKLKEPLFQVTRTRYRGVRASEQENLETNLLKIDLTRIYSELEEVDLAVLDNLELFVGNKSNIDEQTYLSDGLFSSLPGVNFQVEGKALESNLNIDSVDKLSGILARLQNKIQRLETSM